MNVLVTLGEVVVTHIHRILRSINFMTNTFVWSINDLTGSYYYNKVVTVEQQRQLTFRASHYTTTYY